jgi:hypothetical protein
VTRQEIEDEAQHGGLRGEPNAVAGIFTSKLVGGLFALAFGAWAVVLGTVKDDVIEGQLQIQKDLAQIKADVTAHAIFSAQKTAQFDANHAEAERRLRLIEDRHRNGTRHTIASGDE